MARTKNSVHYVVVDAFTESEFKGNPAAVCLLEEERDDEWLQSVASEFNMSQTGFLIRSSESDSVDALFRLRWFTPVAEVKLCGHATLAAAHLCFTSGLVNGDIIKFSTHSGILTARKVPESKLPVLSKGENGEAQQPSFSIELDFPTVTLSDYNANEASSISKVLGGVSIIDIKKTSYDDLFVVLPSAKDVVDLQPQYGEIQKCPGRGLIISALAPPESGFDFYSRFFCPKLGINEDPVCGSAHCALAPYWYTKLKKRDFLAYAASPRSGIVNLHLNEDMDRVKLQGKAVTVMEGFIIV